MKRRHLLLASAASCTSLARAASNIDRLSVGPVKIDIANAALTLAQEFYPALDVQAYSQRIDAFAAATTRLCRGSIDPLERIFALNTVLFKDGGIQYDHDPAARNTQTNYFLNGILDTRKGICVTMPLLYVAVAQRLGYPIFPVQVPDHEFVRYIDPRLAPRGNIETTSGGKYITDAEYIEDFGVSETGRRVGSYMRTLTYREYLGKLFTTNGFIYGRQQNGPKIAEYFEAGARLNPLCADIYEGLGSIYKTMSLLTKGKESERFAEKSMANMKKATELGFVAIENVQSAKQQRIRGRSN